jgi:hypothetical protein
MIRFSRNLPNPATNELKYIYVPTIFKIKMNYINLKDNKVINVNKDNHYFHSRGLFNLISLNA